MHWAGWREDSIGQGGGRTVLGRVEGGQYRAGWREDSIGQGGGRTV